MHRYTLEEELELGRRIRQGDLEAKRLLVEANMGVVGGNIRPYLNRGLDREDLEQEGNVGLLRAADSYDPSCGMRFSTYASYWVRETMKMGLLNHGRSIRLTNGVTKQLTKLNRFKAEFEREHGRKPTPADVKRALGFKAKTIATLEAIVPVVEASSMESDFNLVDPASVCDAEIEKFREDFAAIRQALKRLSSYQRQVVERYFGLHHGTPETLDEIAARLQCNTNLVQSLKNTSLDRLKAIIEKIDEDRAVD
jgi:RNA polymerase primary sigma factor